MGFNTKSTYACLHYVKLLKKKWTDSADWRFLLYWIRMSHIPLTTVMGWISRKLTLRLEEADTWVYYWKDEDSQVLIWD